MRHIFSFHHNVLGVIWNKYTHPECSTITEWIWAVIRICDYESVQVLFTPKLQVGMELSLYWNVCNWVSKILYLMGAYRKLYFWKKFIEFFLIHAVDISTCIHSNHNMMVVGPSGWLTMENLRCFPSLTFPLLASIWLTTLSIFTLEGGFGCLSPFSSMWMLSSSWGLWTRLALCLALFLLWHTLWKCQILWQALHS